MLRHMAVVGLSALMVGTASAQQMRPNTLDPSYRHDRFGTEPRDALREFRAFVSSFDTDDDDDGDDVADILAIPQWVAQEIRGADSAPESKKRPPTWFTDAELAERGWAPTDASYAYSKAFRDEHENWFDRGHLAQKYLAERLGEDAAWNTHTVLNAVPQRRRFNSGIWLELECKTGAWANKYGAIWVISGPVFLSGRPTQWIGEPEKGEPSVAVPDALFKIVLREIAQPPGITALAFVYPQDHDSYKTRPWDHTIWLTTIDRIEMLTGLDFLTSLSPAAQRGIERRKAKAIWPHHRSDFDPGCKQFAKDAP